MQDEVILGVRGEIVASDKYRGSTKYGGIWSSTGSSLDAAVKVVRGDQHNFRVRVNSSEAQLKGAAAKASERDQRGPEGSQED